MIVSHYNDIATLNSSKDGTMNLDGCVLISMGVYCIEASLNWLVTIYRGLAIV